MFWLRNSLSAFDHLGIRTSSLLCSLALLPSMIVFCGVVSNAQSGPDWKLELPISQQFGGPPRRYDFAMSTCQNGNVAIFGGTTFENGFSYLNDTWIWDGSNWIDISQSIRPSVRGYASMAFDAPHNQVVLFGGQGFSGNLGDTWIFNGSQWIERHPATSPPARFGASMAYDELTGVVILFGGQGGPKNHYLNDTWIWNGSTWSQPIDNVRPSPRFGAAMAYFRLGGYTLLFGGFGTLGLLGDTNGYSSLLLRVGGVLIWPTPGWNDFNLRFAVPMNVLPRFDASISSYPVAQKVILFGGSTAEPFYRSDTYSWTSSPTSINLGPWSQEHPLTHPPGRTGARMAYHPATGRLVLFGGYYGNQELNDTWTWGKQVACLPGDASTVRVGSTVRCFFKEDADVHFGYWTTDGFSPNSTTTLNKTFHTNGPGPASITATWFDSAGMHNETFNFTIRAPARITDDDRDAMRNEIYPLARSLSLGD